MSLISAAFNAACGTPVFSGDCSLKRPLVIMSGIMEYTIPSQTEDHCQGMQHLAVSY